MNFERCVLGDGNFVCSTSSVALLQRIEPFKDNLTWIFVALCLTFCIIYLITVLNNTYRFESINQVRIAEIESEFEDDSE